MLDTLYLPNVEANWIHHSGLDYFLSRKHTPRDSYRLSGVTVCRVVGSLLVNNVVVDRGIGRKNFLKHTSELWTGKELEVGLKNTKKKR